MRDWNESTGAPAKEAKAGPDAGLNGVEVKSRVTVLDLLLILLERKWFILVGMALISAAAVLTTVFVLTSYYTAESVVLPSKGKSGSPLSALAGDLPIGGLLKSFDLFGGSDNNRFLTILDSRRLADQVIERYDLAQRYGFKKRRKFYYENVLKEYHKNVVIYEDQLDNIHVAVTDTNPQAAADIANYIVDLLDSISFQISRQDARGSRIFFEERMALMRKNLDSVHHAFAAFQTKHKFIDLEQQVKASIEALAGIEAEAMSVDIERELLSSSFGSNSRIAEVQRKKAVLDKRLKEYMKEGSGSLVLPLMKTPELGIQYAYLFRDVKVHETLYAFLLQMYEQAKFQEANNSPMVTVLERAQAPEKRTRPKRAVICILAFFGGLVFLCSWTLVAHWYGKERARHSEGYQKMRRVLAHFRPAR